MDSPVSASTPNLEHVVTGSLVWGGGLVIIGPLFFFFLPLFWDDCWRPSGRSSPHVLVRDGGDTWRPLRGSSLLLVWDGAGGAASWSLTFWAVCLVTLSDKLWSSVASVADILRQPARWGQSAPPQILFVWLQVQHLTVGCRWLDAPADTTCAEVRPLIGRVFASTPNLEHVVTGSLVWRGGLVIIGPLSFLFLPLFWDDCWRPSGRPSPSVLDGCRDGGECCLAWGKERFPSAFTFCTSFSWSHTEHSLEEAMCGLEELVHFTGFSQPTSVCLPPQRQQTVSDLQNLLPCPIFGSWRLEAPQGVRNIGVDLNSKISNVYVAVGVLKVKMKVLVGLLLFSPDLTVILNESTTPWGRSSSMISSILHSLRSVHFMTPLLELRVLCADACTG